MNETKMIERRAIKQYVQALRNAILDIELVDYDENEIELLREHITRDSEAHAR